MSRSIITEEYREFHRRVIHERYEHVFIPAWKNLAGRKLTSMSDAVARDSGIDPADPMNLAMGESSIPGITR